MSRSLEGTHCIYQYRERPEAIISQAASLETNNCTLIVLYIVSHGRACHLHHVLQSVLFIHHGQHSVFMLMSRQIIGRPIYHVMKCPLLYRSSSIISSKSISMLLVYTYFDTDDTSSRRSSNFCHWREQAHTTPCKTMQLWTNNYKDQYVLIYFQSWLTHARILISNLVFLSGYWICLPQCTIHKQHSIIRWKCGIHPNRLLHPNHWRKSGRKNRFWNLSVQFLQVVVVAAAASSSTSRLMTCTVTYWSVLKTSMDHDFCNRRYLKHKKTPSREHSMNSDPILMSLHVMCLETMLSRSISSLAPTTSWGFYYTTSVDDGQSYHWIYTAVVWCRKQSKSFLFYIRYHHELVCYDE